MMPSYRYLSSEKLSPRLLSENVKELVRADAKGYLLFDDTVLDKRYSELLEVRRQYSGAEHRVIRAFWLNQLHLR